MLPTYNSLGLPDKADAMTHDYSGLPHWAIIRVMIAEKSNKLALILFFCVCAQVIPHALAHNGS